MRPLNDAQSSDDWPAAGDWSVVLPADAVVARIAAAQHRVIAVEQLRDAGLTRNAVAHRVKHGSLQRMWRRVYLVGAGEPDPFSYAMAAILTCRGAAAISHLWAAFMWRMVALAQLPVDVIVGNGSHRGRREVLVHRTVLLDPRDFTRIEGVPVTAPARTLLDLAAVGSTSTLERAVAEAQVLKRVTERALHEILERCGRHPGAARLRRALDHGPGLTRAESERILRRLLEAAGLPQAHANYRLGRWEVDFFFPGANLVVEVDGYGPHGHRKAFEHDRRKRAELSAMGHTVIAFTYLQLTAEPHFVTATIAAALAQAAQSSYTTSGELVRRASASMPVAGSGREK